MKNLIVRNRKQIETSNEVQDDHIIISIYTPSDTIPIPVLNDHSVSVLSLAFHDLDGQPALATELALGEIVLFNDEMAHYIVSFVSSFNSVDTIVVHCDAGQSRSAGVAAAIAKFFNGNDDRFFNSLRYTPNRLAYRKVLQAFHGVGK
jgi:predicted protein tyrosine phosphatase